MRLQSRRQFENSKQKLATLVERCREIRAAGELTEANQLTLWSLGKIVKQLKEEIALYEAHHSTVRQT